MVRTSLQRTISDFRRFRDVVTVFFEEGLAFFVDGMRLRYLVPGRRRLYCVVRRGATECRRVFFGEHVDPPIEVRFRRAFERLGPTFIKLGQLLSLRPDIAPPEFVREFAKLLDGVKGLTPGVAEKIIEEEFGQPIENIFRDFDTVPIAAASLAQVHKATLKDGTKVAVKVRRPGIVPLVQTDIDILAYFANLLEKYVPESKKYQPVRVAREFAEWTLAELDFTVEGAHMDRFRAAFVNEPSVVIPRVYWEYTKQSVLVMDLVEGVKIDDVAGMRKAKLDPQEVARTGLRAGFVQFFISGFFHADPHPGNLVALRPSELNDDGSVPQTRICLFDFGIVGTLTEKTRYELVSCFLSYLNKDTETYLRHILDLAESTEDADLEGFQREVRTLVTGILYKPTQQKVVALAFYQVLLSAARHGIRFSTDLVLLGKAFLTLETMGLKLFPDIDIDTELRPFLVDVMKKELSPANMVRDLEASAFDTLYFLKRLPEQTRVLLDRFEKGSIGVKIDLEELHDLKAEFDRQNDVRVLGVLVAALLLGSAVAMRLDQKWASAGDILGQFGFVAAIVVTVWLFVLIRRKPGI